MRVTIIWGNVQLTVIYASLVCYAAAKADEKVQSFLTDKNVVKEIYVPGKLVNIVAK